MGGTGRARATLQGRSPPATGGSRAEKLVADVVRPVGRLQEQRCKTAAGQPGEGAAGGVGDRRGRILGQHRTVGQVPEAAENGEPTAQDQRASHQPPRVLDEHMERREAGLPPYPRPCRQLRDVGSGGRRHQQVPAPQQVGIRPGRHRDTQAMCVVQHGDG